MPKKITTEEEVTEAPNLTKKIRNIAPNKREIDIMGNLYTIQPNEVIDVPESFNVPKGIGLQEIK